MNSSAKILKEYIRESLVSASSSYLEKEKIKNLIQQDLLTKIKNGTIESPEQLDDYFSTLTMAIKSLEVVPFEVWSKIASS